MMCLKFFSRSTMTLQLISQRYRIERHSSTSTYIHLPSDFRESLQIQDQYLGIWVLDPVFTEIHASSIFLLSAFSLYISLSLSLPLHQSKLKRYFPCVISSTEKFLRKKPPLKNPQQWEILEHNKIEEDASCKKISFTLFIAL